MNDPNKRIDVNLSSLLSLKAELLRKQEEVNRAKKQNPSTANEFTIRQTTSGLPSKKSKQKTKDEAKPEEPKIDRRDAEECAEMLLKSRRILEAKAKLYDRMTASGGTTNSDDTCLILFNKKKQQTDTRRPSTSESSDDERNRLDEKDDDDDNLWTEYVDCLGRTRKCLKSDLKYYKEKDSELAEVAASRMNAQQVTPQQREEVKETTTETQQNWFVDTKGISSDDLPLHPPNHCDDSDDTMSMMSKASKMEEMRMQWEHKEQENLNRDKIHYQDVLFDEARTHGVGYYAFSVDEQERRRQQKEFETERERTLEAQRQRDQQRQTRERIIADRVFAAKNRQRARQGLPPMSREEFDKKPAEEDKEQDESSIAKEEKKRQRKEEKEHRRKERKERKREEGRKQHLRPWDEGKDGAPAKPSSSSSDSSDDAELAAEKWEYKPEKRGPMSQDEWNEMKRTERNVEFAPFVEPQPLNRFTTIKPKTFKRRNIDPTTTTSRAQGNIFNEPIHNEIDQDYSEPISKLKRNDEVKIERRGAEIPPPMSMDYFGPTSSMSAAKTKTPAAQPRSELEASISAGLKFLREQSDKTASGSKQKWVSNVDY